MLAGTIDFNCPDDYAAYKKGPILSVVLMNRVHIINFAGEY